MKRLLTLMILLTSYLNAGLYGGIELQSMSIDGTYKETYRGETQQWDTAANISLVGLNLGYGYVDAFSGEVYMALGSDSGKLGANLRYGFDVFDNSIFPHILLGGGYVGGSGDVRISGNSNTPYTITDSSSDGSFFTTNSVDRYDAVFVQIGVGLSYVMKDTVEIYGDIFLMLDNNEVRTESFIVEDNLYSGYNYNPYSTTYSDVRVEQTWNTPSIGFQIGVKFHPFGAATLRGKHLKQDQLEEYREKNIDAFIN